MLKKIRANMVFSFDLKSFYKSIWLGPLLITWCIELHWYQIRDLDFSWYGFSYWQPQEAEWID